VTASSKQRRNHTLFAALSGVIVLIAAPLLGYLGWNVLQDSKAGTAAKALDEVAFPSTPTALLAIVDDQQVITSLAVMVLAPESGKGGTLVAVPTSASTAQSSDGDQVPVADSLINAGEEGVVSDIESLMRVTLNQHAIVDDQDLAALLAPVPPMSVSLPNDVITASDDGSTQTLFVAGTSDLSADDAASVLLARDPSQAESRRLPNVRAVWNGLATAVGAGIAPEAAQSPTPTDFADFMKHFFAGPIQVFNDLNAVPITGKSNPDKRDVGRLDVATVVLLMAGLAPSAMIAPLPTINFRIENGVTQQDIDAAGLENLTPVDVTKDLVSRLLFLQGNVISVSPEVFTPEDKTVPDTTMIYSIGGIESTELNVFTKALGDVKFVDPTFKFPLVQVVIVVGRSYLADMAEKAAAGGTSVSDTSGDSVDTSTGDTTTGANDTTPVTDDSATTVTS
jgi:hypothetical protein